MCFFLDSLDLCPCVQEAEDHSGGRHGVHVHQHALQSHGAQHPAGHQGAAGAHAGSGAEVGRRGASAPYSAVERLCGGRTNHCSSSRPSPALTAVLYDLSRQIPQLKKDIQDGLLKMLSLVLMHKPLRHPGMPKGLAHQMASPSLTNIPEAGDVGGITLALRTLGSFEFEG